MCGRDNFRLETTLGKSVSEETFDSVELHANGRRRVQRAKKVYLDKFTMTIGDSTPISYKYVHSSKYG